MAFKGNSENKQAALRRITPKRLGDFPIEPTTEEAFENNRIILHRLEQEILALNKNDPDRIALGQRKNEISMQQKELRKQLLLKRKIDVAAFIIRIVKDRLTKAEYQTIVDLAKKRHEETGGDEVKAIALGYIG